MIETTTGADGLLPRPGVFPCRGGVEDQRKVHLMAEFQVLNVAELGRIEGGKDKLECHTVEVTGLDGKNYSGVLCLPPSAWSPPPQKA
jgi:hypothetical protein